MYYKKINIFILFLLSFADSYLFTACPDGKKSYEYLTRDPFRPFVLGFGTSMSQTHATKNTMKPAFVRKTMLDMAKKQGSDKSRGWLKDKDRFWYLLRAMPLFSCSNGHQIDITALVTSKTDPKAFEILNDIVDNSDFRDDFTITKCPICKNKDVTKGKEHDQDLFGEKEQNELVNLLKQFDDSFAKHNSLPNARLSIELSDVLKPGTTEIDEEKLDKLVAFINKIGNPLLFFHHYANPEALPYLFSKESDLEWFADTCAKIMEKLPNITHVCPVSQPVGFSFRVIRQASLPPFSYPIDVNTLIQNIMKASALASDKMKEVRKKSSENAIPLQVLVSHQWKLFLPVHDYYDPRRKLDEFVATIADYKYNGSFTEYVRPYIDKFDGIALSVYPALNVNLWKVEGSNTEAVVDYVGSYGAIVETNKAFPDKDIYVVEAGCDTADPKQKKEYIDMMLCACINAREEGINVKSLFFWAITNHPDFYTEWNTPKGSSNFGPFNSMNPESINPGGKYIKDIMSSVDF